MSSNDLLEKFYKNKIPVLSQNDFTIIMPREDGVLVKNTNEELLWVSLDNTIYDKSEDLLSRQNIVELSEEEKVKAIKQIMGFENHTTYIYEDYLLISKIINNELDQVLYFKDEVIGKGKLYKTDAGYRNIFIDNNDSIFADNIYEFAYIYEYKRRERVVK